MQLTELTSAVEGIAALGTGAQARAAAADRAAVRGAPSSRKVYEILAGHLDAEEPVLLELFPRVPGHDIVRLRKAIVAGAPRSGPYLVLGLLDDPEPAMGREALMRSFPPPVRWLRRPLLSVYRRRKRALGETSW